MLLAYMRAPRSYTGEDVVELHCHGSRAGLREMLRLAVHAGARPAERGEFTLRAFLAGRLDLAQAEAVVDAVQARTPAALSLAVEQLGGGLSAAVRAVRRELLEVLAQLEATIDFSEDDVPDPPPEPLLEQLARGRAQIDGLLATARAGQIMREGVRIALVGRPNAGKSSLLNALLQSERAIVTPIAGTTRDVIEEAIDLEGIPAVIADTAGISESHDPIERLGVARSRAAVTAADVVALIVDGSVPLAAGDSALASEVRRRSTRDMDGGEEAGAANGGAAIVVLNKSDLPLCVSPTEAGSLLPGAAVVAVSALAGSGLDDLRHALARTALAGQPAAHATHGATVVASARHRDALERARHAVADAAAALAERRVADVVCTDLRVALNALGEVTGDSVTEALLSEIFGRFCIGK